MSKQDTVGRFAPSPTGPLHLGSLMSATCSYLQAKANNGKWLVRIEDIDTPRAVKGMADIQLKQLESFGFQWDGSVLYQSSRFDAYQDVLNQLSNHNKIYACECSRKHLKLNSVTSKFGLIYAQTCLNKNIHREGNSLRFKTSKQDIHFIDKVFGEQTFNIQQLSSDWIIKRRDHVFSYHLAVVVDDAFQGISDVVRGVDILALTPLHCDLQASLKLPIPSYCHHPLILNNGIKLSKQNNATAVDDRNKIQTLNIILKALRQVTINETASLNEFWEQAIKQWDIDLIPQINSELSLIQP